MDERQWQIGYLLCGIMQSPERAVHPRAEHPHTPYRVPPHQGTVISLGKDRRIARIEHVNGNIRANRMHAFEQGDGKDCSRVLPENAISLHHCNRLSLQYAKVEEEVM